MKPRPTFSSRIFFQEPSINVLKSDYMLMDMHVHTKYSHDSRTQVKDLLSQASSLGIGFAVTDHIQVQGALDASRQKKIMIIPGIEILSSEGKEILLYFYSRSDLEDFYARHIAKCKMITKEPKSILRRSLVSVKCTRPMSKIIESAGKYSCVKSIPHPYTYLNRSSHRFFANDKKMLKAIDAVEIINSTLQPKRNKRAAAYAAKHNKAFTAGSDAHLHRQLGRAVVAAKAGSVEEFLDAVRKKNTLVLGGEMRRMEAVRNILAMNKIKRHKRWKF